MMFFKDRLKWANKYKEWLSQNPEIADTPLSVITFLVGEGWDYPVNEWIPTKKKLPKPEEERVIVVDKRDQVAVVTYHVDKEIDYRCWYDDWDSFWPFDKLRAHTTSIAFFGTFRRG